MSTNKNPHNINLLIIGNKDWYESLLTVLCSLDEVYTVEFISDIYAANARLWHNSYDILLLEEEFSKKYTIQLSKMSYAMSRPSIILCKNIFKIFFYKLWKNFSKFTNKFVTYRQMILFAKADDKDLLNIISDLAHHHQYFDVITREINSNFSTAFNE